MSRPSAAPAGGGGRLFCLAEIWWLSETPPYVRAHAISRFSFNLLHSPVQQFNCPSRIVQSLASDFAKCNYGCAGFQFRLNFDWLLLQLYYISIRCWHLSILIHFDLYRNEFSQCWWGLWETFVLRAGAGVISLELLEMQMRNFVIMRSGFTIVSV